MYVFGRLQPTRQYTTIAVSSMKKVCLQVLLVFNVHVSDWLEINGCDSNFEVMFYNFWKLLQMKLLPGI